MSFVELQMTYLWKYFDVTYMKIYDIELMIASILVLPLANNAIPTMPFPLG